MKVYKELEKSLKTTCEEFIMATTKLVVDPMLSFVAKQGSPYRAVRPHTARYVPVRQLTDTWTDRYRAKKEEEKYLALSLPTQHPRALASRGRLLPHPRAVVALAARGRLLPLVSPCWERDQGDYRTDTDKMSVDR
ncbi:hypothetical protein BHM03_00051701 [Ensete ventricosum]|nr:hypothetical protein BHM03_00051701 [Ensete ventricosum]